MLYFKNVIMVCIAICVSCLNVRAGIVYDFGLEYEISGNMSCHEKGGGADRCREEIRMSLYGSAFENGDDFSVGDGVNRLPARRGSKACSLVWADWGSELYFNAGGSERYALRYRVPLDMTGASLAGLDGSDRLMTVLSRGAEVDVAGIGVRYHLPREVRFQEYAEVSNRVAVLYDVRWYDWSGLVGSGEGIGIGWGSRGGYIGFRDRGGGCVSEPPRTPRR